MRESREGLGPRLRARGRSRRGTLSKMASFIGGYPRQIWHFNPVTAGCARWRARALQNISTQEVLLHYIRQGESPFLCFYDIEKAFDSIEFPVLLSHLQSIGISGKSWRLIKSWYDSPTSRVKFHNRVSDPFLITRGVKQGSVLSPSLFLVVMNTLIQKLRSISCGASLQGIYTGTAIHADDVRCIAPNVQSLLTQSSEIQSFTDEVGLKLNFSKLESFAYPKYLQKNLHR